MANLYIVLTADGRVESIKADRFRIEVGTHVVFEAAKGPDCVEPYEMVALFSQPQCVIKETKEPA